MTQLRSLFISAGEDSADQLGYEIVKVLPTGVRCFGLGGKRMRAAGFDRVSFAKVESENPLAVIGLGQGLAAVPRLNRLADSMVAAVLAAKPDAVLTIDSKGFALNFAKKLRRGMAAAGWHAPLIHLVVPTVWAWGGWRAKGFADTFDRLLCLFPFEPDYFTKHGGHGGLADYVGHPLFGRKILPQEKARHILGLDKTRPVLALLPGSRAREVASLLPDMLVAGEILCQKHPALSVILPAAESVATQIRHLIKQHGQQDKVQLITSKDRGDHTWLALAAADAGIICSGTVTLECAMNGLPGVAVYRPDILSFVIGSLIGMQRNNVILANVVAGKPIYALKLGREISGASLASDISPILSAPPAKRQQAKHRLQQTLARAIAGAKQKDFGAACVAAIGKAVV